MAFNEQIMQLGMVNRWKIGHVKEVILHVLCSRMHRANTPVIKPTFFKASIDKIKNRLLDSLMVECWLRVREVPRSIPSQGPRHTKYVIKMVPGSSLVKH